MHPIPNSLAARDIASLIHPNTNLKRHQIDGPYVVDRANGVWVTDEDGAELLDGVSGLWCASLGLTNDRLAKVAYEQMRKLSYAHLYRHHSHEPAVELSEKLLSMAPASMTKVHFQCTGSEANDVAVKLVWYYHNAIGRPEKRKIISRLGAYHGSSVAAISLTGKPEMHAEFNLPLDGFLHTDCPHPYRDMEDGESEEDYAGRLARNLEHMIEREDPDTVAAFFAEPVMGSSGAIRPPQTYYEKIQAVLRRHDILFVADEVICGFGRTGRMWGSQTFGIEPDMITCAKALSSGALPISALMLNDKIYDAMLTQSEKTGSFAHGHTYAGHPVSSAVALETLKIYEEMDLLSRLQRMGAALEETLLPLEAHPLVGAVDVIGFMAGLELVKDKARRESFPKEIAIGPRVADASQRHGLIHRGMGQRIAFAPAYVMGEDEIAEMGRRLERSLDDVHREVAST